jgi:hypothetical protein
VSTHCRPVAVSPQLAAAQEQLVKLRQQRRQDRLAAGLPVQTTIDGRRLTPHCPTTQPIPPRPALAPHLGWESEGFACAQQAATARRAHLYAYREAQAHQWPVPSASPPAAVPQSANAAAASTKSAAYQPAPAARVYPDLAVAMLRQGVVAAGRLWLLLQHLDRSGQGWVREAGARAALTTPGSEIYLCGWRQLRNLLAAGDGLFWQRDGGAGEPRIWLASTARVCQRLGVEQIRLEPVVMPLPVLLGGIGAVRAHFYASYHSSRQGRPISRAALADLTAVTRRSQRTYEPVAGVRSQANWAIGPAQQGSDAQELAWRHGQALFTFTDRRGRYGRPGATYFSWQLPNSYQGPHATQGRSPKKALNQQLVDLYSQGMTGNGRQDGEAELQRSRFFDNGRAAVRALRRGQPGETYWLSSQHERRYQIWHLLPDLEEVS